MAKKIGEQIVELAIDILGQHPDGLSYSKLKALITEADPKLNLNTIQGNIWNLHIKHPKKVYKPSHGVFRLVEFQDEPPVVKGPPDTYAEEDFYKPFADWLVHEREDCTKAIPLGGKTFGGKWGTPDVIGKRVSKASDIIQAPIDIVSAEIKADVGQLVTAFGQACAYCLFSHKAYLVIPKTSLSEDIQRLSSLCQVFGIGLVLFNSEDPKIPDFEIRVSPRRQDPDLFFSNKYMKLIEDKLFP